MKYALLNKASAWLQHHTLRLSKEAWVFLGLTVLSAIVLVKFVDLEPRINNDFFFSNDDPQFHDETLITSSFVRKDSLLIINAAGPIWSADYAAKVKTLSDALLRVDGIASVKSISHGAHGVAYAIKSPFWKRLLIPKNGRSTNIIAILKTPYPKTTIADIEKEVRKLSAPGFHVVMSGPPYIVELISRHLIKDIKLFSVLALVIFGVVIFFIFRSWGILLGTMISCINASVWVLMIVHLLHIKIGLLTANLATIVFVLTLSHIVFLTYNWKYACTHPGKRSSVDEAMCLTFSPSFWCMLTALLGFFSLLSVPAQPLKELGASGIAGALVALSVAYGIYPAFLRLVTPCPLNPDKPHKRTVLEFLEKNKKNTVIAVFCLCVLALPGLWMADTDPSLISYFTKGSEISRGLTYIDRNGGSSPLILVVKAKNGEKLDSDHAYHQLWKLQKALEQYSAVGTVISLPVLMAEAKRSLIASFLSWEWLLNILQQPQFESISKSFITDDHTQGLFLLRMNESGRKVPRLQVVEEIKNIVDIYGFKAELTGGTYTLQGRLSKLVSSSVIFGLGQLILIFALVAWVIARSLRIAAAITLSICVIPVIVLGTVGWLRIPLDIISAPASNIALGLGIDSMIHMVRAYRREKKAEKKPEQAWQHVREHFWQPVLSFTLIMVLGFGIFTFSAFPSTQRFGGAIVFGTLIAALTALFVMPWVAQLDLSRFKCWGKTTRNVVP